MKNKTIAKKRYAAPEFTLIGLRLTDVIMTSPIEQYKETIIDGGDWGDGDGANSFGGDLLD